MGGAEDGGVDAAPGQLGLHVLKVHPPHPVLVLTQRAVDDLVAAVGQALGKANVGGGVDQDPVAPGAEHVQRGDYASQHPVLIADVLRLQAGDPVAVPVPGGDGVVIRLGGGEVAVGRVLDPADDGLGNGGEGGKTHVRHPHGDGVKALLGGAGGKAGGRAQGVHRQGVHPPAVQYGGKIIFHIERSFSLDYTISWPFINMEPPRRRGNLPAFAIDGEDNLML